MYISINLDTKPRLGRTTTLLRCHSEDKRDIDRAARILGMSTQAYMRTVIIKASRTIIADAEGAKGNGKDQDKG